MTSKEAYDTGVQLALKTAGMSDLQRILALTGGGAAFGGGAGALLAPEGQRGQGALEGAVAGGAGGLVGSSLGTLAKRLVEAKQLQNFTRDFAAGNLPKPGTPESQAMVARMLGG